MSDAQRLIPWLTLALLTVVGAAGAALGIQQSPQQATLDRAVSNTLKAPNYSSLLVSTGTQAATQNLVWEAPDRIGGYVDTGKRRFYVAVIGSFEYQSTQVSTSTGPTNLTFLKGASQPASAYDPVQGYLPYAQKATDIHRNGDVYSFTVTQQGQTAQFTVTVSGQYVSDLTITATGLHADLSITDVGTSPPVTLPAGAKVKAVSGTGTGSSSGAAG